MKHVFKIYLLTFTLTALADGTDDHSHHQGQGKHGHAEQGMNNGHHKYAFGQAGQAENADRSIEVVMTDNKFDLPSLNVKPGETIHFRIKNEGRQIHEFNIATAQMHTQHQAEMQNHINSGHMTMTDRGHGKDHDHANSLLLNPGESGDLVWSFDRADDLEFACNVPGHYQSGMLGAITVE